jgi:hypothetical protein
MDLDADPIVLCGGADRLSALAGDLATVAGRLDRLAPDGRSHPGGVADRCAALVAALRGDAAELTACEELLRLERSRLLATETSALVRMAEQDRRLRELPGWAR